MSEIEGIGYGREQWSNAAPEPVEVPAVELAAAEAFMRPVGGRWVPQGISGLVMAEYHRRGVLLAALLDGLSPWLRDGEPPAPGDEEIRASVGQMNDDFTEASNGWALARAERDRLRAFLLEATGTLPFHGFTNDELGDPWVRWLERVAAYLTETC